MDNIWPGSRVLADFLSENSSLFTDKTVLELGAGAALPSLVALRLGARNTVITDFPDESILANIRHELQANHMTRSAGLSSHVNGFQWGGDIRPIIELNNGQLFDVILLAEVLWKDTYSLHSKLVDSISSFLEPCGGIVLLTVVHRLVEGLHSAAHDLEFLTRLERKGFTATLLSVTDAEEVNSEEPVGVKLFIMRRSL